MSQQGFTVYFDDDWLVDGGGIDTVRKADRVAARIRAHHPQIELAPADPVTVDDLLLAHDRAYVDAVLSGEPRSLATGGLGTWSPDIVRSVLGSTGGVIAAMQAALRDGRSGSLSSGLHHATRGGGRGFCTFNGLAVAALVALQAGVGRVGILDTDAHCGGGTFSIVGHESRIRLADVATNGYDSWRSAEERHHLRVVGRADEYLDAAAAAIDHLGDVDLLLYNAGMDSADTDRIGSGGIAAGVLAERERMVAWWCERTSTPVAFVLAGGYGRGDDGLDTVADLHLLTVDALASIGSPR